MTSRVQVMSGALAMIAVAADDTVLILVPQDS